MRRRSAGSSITLTGRGGIVVILSAGLLGTVLGALFGVGVAPGLGFVAGCVLAAGTTRRGDLLTLVVSPPLIFLAVTVISEFAGVVGERPLLQSLFVGVVTTLASNAPWLFVGTALVVGITLRRGLLTTLRAVSSARPQSTQGEDDDPVRWDE